MATSQSRKTKNQSKRWIFTLNNPTISEELTLELYDSKYMIYGRETAPTTGTPHLQGYIIFKVNHRLAKCKELLPRASWHVADGTTQQNIDYCSKENNITETGIRPKTSREVAQNNHDRWTDILKTAKEGTCEEHYPAEWVRHNSFLSKLFKPILPDNPHLCGIWYHGPSGSGKSRTARANFPGFYDKLLNKWWDSYDLEDHVLIDDLDHFSAPKMGTALKRYADHYPFRVEVKGSSMVIRPKTIIVTSQYTIEELYPDDAELQTALRRRYQVTNF